jgi:hypothetical protein
MDTVGRTPNESRCLEWDYFYGRYPPFYIIDYSVPLSFLKLRRPRYDKFLIGFRRISFRPSCGVILTASKSRELNFSPGKDSLAAVDDSAGFTEEDYPKDIRLFTTPDETVLTNRFVRFKRPARMPHPRSAGWKPRDRQSRNIGWNRRKGEKETSIT